MKLASFGDLASHFGQQRTTATIKSELSRLTGELSTGRKSKIAIGSSGDFAPYVSLERTINMFRGFETSIAEARLFTETLQASLDRIKSHGDELAPALLTAATSQNNSAMDAAAFDAANRFASVVSALNINVAGRFALAGTATDTAPIADPQIIISDIMVSIAGLATVADIENALTAWFETPGTSFDAVAYQGSLQPLSPVRIGEREEVDLAATAADPEYRVILKSFAMAAIVEQGVLSADPTERAELTKRSAEMILAAQGDLATVRAKIGAAEARIQQVSLASSAERTALEMARAELVTVDPYETATALEGRRVQLETVFAVTARLSQLRLTDFLR